MGNVSFSIEVAGESSIDDLQQFLDVIDSDAVSTLTVDVDATRLPLAPELYAELENGGLSALQDDEARNTEPRLSTARKAIWVAVLLDMNDNSWMTISEITDALEPDVSETQVRGYVGTLENNNVLERQPRPTDDRGSDPYEYRLTGDAADLLEEEKAELDEPPEPFNPDVFEDALTTA